MRTKDLFISVRSNPDIWLDSFEASFLAGRIPKDPYQIEVHSSRTDKKYRWSYSDNEIAVSINGRILEEIMHLFNLMYDYLYRCQEIDRTFIPEVEDTRMAYDTALYALAFEKHEGKYQTAAQLHKWKNRDKEGVK